jgi:DNA polymerase-3 subunit gamma/tau
MLIFKNTNVSDEDQMIFANKNFITLSNQLSNNLIFHYIDILHTPPNDMKGTTNAKLYMELALIKMVDYIEKQEIIFQDEIDTLRKELLSLKDELDTKEFTVVQKEDVISTPKEEPKVEVIEEPETEQVEEPKFDDLFTHEQPVVEEKQEEKVVEQPVVELKTEPKVEVAEEPKEEKKDESNLFTITPETPKQEEKKDEPYKTYDIRYVEKVLNNGNREAKIQMNKMWFDIERHVSPEQMTYAKWITSGRVVATNGEMIIIQYSNASLCNRMMKPDVKEIVIKLLSTFYKKDLDYVALPIDVWEQKSQEFIKKWKTNKNEYITLSQIEHPALKEIPKFKKEVNEFTPDSVKDAISIFGSDAVKVKKGEK